MSTWLHCTRLLTNQLVSSMGCADALVDGSLRSLRSHRHARRLTNYLVLLANKGAYYEST
jgi:hypothetical protein